MRHAASSLPPHLPTQDFVATLPYGLPHERAARIAARRAFVGMKSVYLDVVATLDGTEADALREAVRRAQEPWQLLALQDRVLRGLPSWRPGSSRRRMQLRRATELLFDPAPASPLAA